MQIQIQPLFIKLLLVSFILSGCVSKLSDNSWPDSLPERTLFVESWQAQRDAGTNKSPLEAHLTWIKRFYLGSVLYPTGWNHMTESLLDSLDSDLRRNKLEPKLHDLGIQISIEWAQDNSIRKINSSAIATWGNALRTAAERNEQELFIEKIQNDVNALLNEELYVKQINRERYYPPEDYDNF